MKFLLSFIWFTITLVPQRAGDIRSEIATHIRTGNAKELANYFSSSVDLTMLGKEEIYSKVQAEQVMRDFFQKNPPKSFVLLNASSNPASAQHGIGTYVSTQEKTFRIYFLLKRIGNQSFLNQLSIESQN